MAVANFDGENLLITISTGVTQIDVQVDLYSAWKNWQLDFTGGQRNTKYPPAFRVSGGDPLSSGINAGGYFFLRNDFGWRIKGAEEDAEYQVIGNLVPEDASIRLIEPTNGGYVSLFLGLQPITQNIDTLLLSLEQDVEFSSFQNAVTIDVINGVSGTGNDVDGKPIGTVRTPVNNFTDAITIATNRGFNNLRIRGNNTVGSGITLIGYDIYGESVDRTYLVLEEDAIIKNCTFYNMEVNGYLDGESSLMNCNVDTLYYVSGDIKNSQLNGSIFLSGTSASFINCWSGVAGSETPVIDLNGSGTTLFMRNYNGGIKLQNKNGDESLSIDINSGQIILDNTITNGDLILRGIAKLTNNSTGTAKVNSSDLLKPADVSNIQLLIENLRPDHKSTGKLIFWDPLNGDDTNSGAILVNAVKTFTKAHDLAEDWGHDTIIIVPSNTSGTTIVTEPIQITKNWLFLRGPGLDITITPTGTTSGNSLIDISGTVGVELSGFYLSGSSTSGHGITMDSHSVLIHNIKLFDITGNGITTANCANNVIENVVMTNISDIGIDLHDCIHFWGKNIEIKNANIGFQTSASGAGLSGYASLDNMLFTDCNIGINIGNLVEQVSLRYTCRFLPSVKTLIIDNGIDTHNEFSTLFATIRSGKAQSGNTINTIKLDAYASSVDGSYDPSEITITDGTGIGQTRNIIDYNGTTKVAVVDKNWRIIPDETTYFLIKPDSGKEHINAGLTQSATLNTITLNDRSSSVDDIYNGQTVFIRSGTGEDQVAIIKSYTGSTKTATIDKNWNVVPNNTSAYIVLPTQVFREKIAETVWQSLTSGTIEGTFGETIIDLWKHMGLDTTDPLVITENSETDHDMDNTGIKISITKTGNVRTKQRTA